MTLFWCLLSYQNINMNRSKKKEKEGIVVFKWSLYVLKGAAKSMALVC